jgi:hypothetical protein
MKIKRIHTIVAVISLDHKFSFDSSSYRLDYFPDVSMFKVNDTLIPVSNIREVMLDTDSSRMVTHYEEEGRVQASSSHASLLNIEEDSRPDTKLPQTRRKSK